MDQVDVQAIRARADARIDGCATRTDINVLCDEVDRLRAVVAEIGKLPSQWVEDANVADTADWVDGVEHCSDGLRDALDSGSE